MKLKVKDIDMLLSLEAKPLFLDAPIDYEKNRELTDCVKSEGEFYDGVDDKIRDLRELLSHLPEREQDIITSYYGLDGGVPMTLEQISKKYGVSRERIRQVKDATLKSIRLGLSIRATSSTNPKK
jgi:RNA polymerase sigma factor (sigma-70 family)